MDYDFVKLSDVPVAEDGATHVLGTKDGQVVRVPASGLGAVALDLEIAGDSAGPTSVLEELYAALSDYIRCGCVLLYRLFTGEELRGTYLVISAAYRASGDAHMLWLYSDGLELMIFDRDSGEA